MQGKLFIHSVLASRNLKLFRRAGRDLFTEAELPLLDFVSGYVDHYGALPSTAVAADEGHELPSLRNASDEYYFDTLKGRKAYTEVNTRHPRLREAMRSQNITEMLNVLREMTTIVAPLTSTGLTYQTFEDSALEVEQDYRAQKLNSRLTMGIPFGWPTADRATCGMLPGDLVSIAGRPSLGKSKALIEIAYNAVTSAVRTALVSAEMPKKQLSLRMIGRMTGVNTALIRRGTLGTYAEARFEEVVGNIGDTYPNLFVFSTSSLDDIFSMVEEVQPELLLIDSAYLLRMKSVRKAMQRWEVLSEITGYLRSLALSAGIPICMTIQFNRSRKASSNSESDLSELGGTDSYGQDSSIVLGMRRGAAPFQHLRRTFDIVKNREGDTPTFVTEFSFAPPRMEEIICNETGTAATLPTDWMI